MILLTTSDESVNWGKLSSGALLFPGSTEIFVAFIGENFTFSDILFVFIIHLKLYCIFFVRKISAKVLIYFPCFD